MINYQGVARNQPNPGVLAEKCYPLRDQAVSLNNAVERSFKKGILDWKNRAAQTISRVARHWQLAVSDTAVTRLQKLVHVSDSAVSRT